MPQRLSCAVVATLSCLFVATSASAECAWVLWERTMFYRPGEAAPGSSSLTLEIQSSHALIAQCEAAATQRTVP